MTARDDYPYEHSYAYAAWERMCDELDELREANARLRAANLRLTTLTESSPR